MARFTETLVSRICFPWGTNLSEMSIQRPLVDPDPEAGNRSRGFSRAFTFENGGAFARASTQFGFRTITDHIGLTYDSEEQWTRSLIAEYVQNASKGTEGDLPLPSGFAKEFRFWRMMFLAGVIGCFMGLVGLCFLNIADYTPRQWTNNDKFADPSDCQFWQGEKYWIAITTSAGFAVGFIRWITEFPENIDGIFKEINSYHVDYTIAPQTLLLSVISLAGGASLGPEQALGTAGGGLCTWLLEYIGPELDEDDRKILVLIGMTAAIGSLFPSPILTVLMIYELGNPPKTMMESVTILAFAAVCAFMVNYELIQYTWQDYITTKGIILSAAWDYDNTQCVTGFVIGIISAALSITSILFIGVSKQIFQRIRKRLERNKFAQSVVGPTLAGLIIGIVNWGIPLSVGNGNLTLPSVVGFGYKHELSTHLLIATGFARMFTLGLSMQCVGFVGGFVFPTITIGVIAGVVCWQQYTYLPYGLCISCFLAGIPAGICPMPFTLSCLAIFVFFFGLYQTAPILIATLTSYTLVQGSGFFAALQARAKAREEAEAAAKAAAEEDAKHPNGTMSNRKEQHFDTREKVAEDNLSLAKYLDTRSAAAVTSTGSH